MLVTVYYILLHLFFFFFLNTNSGTCKVGAGDRDDPKRIITTEISGSSERER